MSKDVLVTSNIGLAQITDRYHNNWSSEFGDRIRLTLYIPDTATVKQLRDVLYWPKSYKEIDSSDCYSIEDLGICIEVSCKPDNIQTMINELQACAGGVVMNAQEVERLCLTR